MIRIILLSKDFVSSFLCPAAGMSSTLALAQSFYASAEY
jgi:hypothetical protein